MRFLGWNAAVSGWLVISAFVLPRSAASAGVTILAAFFAVSIAAFAMARPGLRFLNAPIAVGLAGMALFGGLPGPAAIHDGLVAPLLFALTLVSPQHHAREESPALATGN